jgi:hypothetical protein
MFSSERRRSRWLLVMAMAGPLAPLAQAGGRTQCQPDEKVYFSCSAGKKMVSLCGQQAEGRIATLSYRYGLPGKVENEFVATSANGQHFIGTAEPVSPRAEIQEVWFNRGEFSYLMTTCLGGDCTYDAGLAVLRRGKVISNLQCKDGPDLVGVFSSDLVEFGAGPGDSKSKTPLLKIDAYNNPVDKLYPVSPGSFP